MSTPTPLLRATLLACVLVAGTAAQAATVWNEAVNGDFSNLGASPSLLALAPGSNLVMGTTGRVNGVVDRDYFRFTLPPGQQLDTLTVMPGTVALGLSALSFIAVQAGTQVTVNPTGGSPAGLLGYWHFGENDIGFDILGVMSVSQGAIGFNSPLPAGDYAFWIQDTGNGTATYHLDFGVSAVPEAASAALWLAGLAVLALPRHQRAAVQRPPRARSRATRLACSVWRSVTSPCCAVASWRWASSSSSWLAPPSR